MTNQENLTFLLRTDDISEGERSLVEVKGREVAIFNVEGEYYALSNYCPHQGGPICEGQVSGALVERNGELTWEGDNEFVSCPWHGWEFEIDTGKHITNDRYGIPSYDITVIDGALYADL